MVKEITIAGRPIGPRHPCFVIAEAGVNHNGDLALAFRLIDAAVNAGADAVKFQTFKADALVTRSAPKAAYQRESTDAAESQFEMLRRLELTPAAHRELFAHCREKRILFMSTPFDEESADLLGELSVAVFKIPSGELTNTPFLTHVAKKQRPMIVSTGMSRLGEVETAVETIRATGNEDLVLLHCVSNYPADAADVNLRAMLTLAAAFGVPVGYSDHTLGIEVALAAVALGAVVIEKHVTLDRSMPGPDHKASSEPDELAALVRGIRKVEVALGDGIKRPAIAEADTAAVARKSLVASRALKAGERLGERDVAVKRPGTGLPPSQRPLLIGRALTKDIAAGELLTFDLVR